MNTIQNLFQQAQLAEAAYANFYDASGNLITTDALIKAALIAAGYSSDPNNPTQSAQATAFTTHWRVVDQYTAPAGLFGLTDGTGFSATVFESLDHPGQYSIAMRGTQPGYSDLSADLGDIVADGVAVEQVIDMYNYWQSLTNTGVYQAAYLDTLMLETAQLKVLWAQTLIGGMSIYKNYVAQLNSASIIVNMGLDGPTAQQVKFGNSDTVLANTAIALGTNALSCAATVDVSGHSLGGHLAMAFSRLFPGSTTEAVAVNGAGFNFGNGNVDVLFSKLGGAPGFDADKITNAVGTAAMNVVSQDWLFLQQPAGRTDIYTEDGGVDNVLGHGASQVTDSLAVYNLFATLDPTLDTGPDGLAKITAILQASDNIATETLESAVTALGKLFGAADATFTGSEFDTDRNLLYKAVNGINAAVICYSGSFTVHDLTTLTAAQLASIAESNISYRYALAELNPFAVTGNDTIYEQHNTSGELDLYDPLSHTGSLTEQYLADRASMLLAQISANTDDASAILAANEQAGWAEQSGEEILYRDYSADANGTVINTALYQGDNIFTMPLFGGNYTTTPNSDMRQIQFGSTEADILTGGNKDDRLYGMAGNDTLQGGKGNDYLEGGAGTDIYKYATGDGFDTILDTDGNGSIVVDNAPALSGGAQYGDSRVHRDASGHCYVSAGSSLIIDSSMLVLNYDEKKGNGMGITLAGPAADPVLAALTGNDKNNFIGTGVYDMGSTASVLSIVSTLDGAAAGNILEGGAGIDILSGGGGNDRLYAGSQISAADAIALGNTPNSGNSFERDWLSGGTGNDTLIGSDGQDVLMGGDGEDLLIGGAGNDVLAGDYTWVASSFAWTVTALDSGPREINISNGDPNASYTAPTVGAADVIYAGNGNDAVSGGFGNDVIFGEGGNDYILGDEGNDIMVGGKDNDILDGGAGTDIYIYNRGDGFDSIRETTSGNILRFGAGISSSDITLKLGSLMLDLGNGDEIHIDNFDQNDVFNSSCISGFEFVDGATRWRAHSAIIDRKAANDACLEGERKVA